MRVWVARQVVVGSELASSLGAGRVQSAHVVTITASRSHTPPPPGQRVATVAGSGWCYRLKADFLFKYDQLEDELTA